MITEPVYIVDIIKECFDSALSYVYSKATGLSLLATIQANETTVFGSTNIIGIDYQYGHVQELLETLSQMTKSKEEYLKKYPLAWLVQDFEEVRGDGAYYSDVSLNIIIAHQTNKDYKITDRMANVFKPVLYPIYYTFLQELASSKWIVQGSIDSIEHTKIDRSYWGSNPVDGNKGNVLTDYVDAIEIQNLKLKINFKNC
jgi:hypothetical protein